MLIAATILAGIGNGAVGSRATAGRGIRAEMRRLGLAWLTKKRSARPENERHVGTAVPAAHLIEIAIAA